MMKIFVYIFIIFGLLRVNPTSKLKTEQEIDQKKTRELITQVIIDQKNDYLNSSCISEIPRATSPMMRNDFDKYIQYQLKISDSIHLKRQLNLYKNFIITKDIVPSKNIVTEEFFEKTAEKRKKSKKSIWELLNETCSNGYASISKPIFNENYSKAYIEYGMVCGGLCGGGEAVIYIFKDEKWIKFKVLNYWMS